ncbi:MAG TPA: sigma-70 family RNA polymerase sigma factor [Puia sp.]|nr:sigma-70 family RNA polymerase sigma factor [Puia sp.]
MEPKSPRHIFSITDFREGRALDFNYVYESYYDTIYIFAYNLIGHEADAQDITTDTFVKLWRLHANFESFQNIKAFLYITCRNGCMDYFRQIRKEREAIPEIIYLQRIDELATSEMIDAEVFTELGKLIEKLPFKCRTIFKLIYNDNLSTSEVAGKLNISNQNVLNQKARAIHILHGALVQKLYLPLSLPLLIMLFIIPG